MTLAVEAWSLNHWAAREGPTWGYFGDHNKQSWLQSLEGWWDMCSKGHTYSLWSFLWSHAMWISPFQLS